MKRSREIFVTKVISITESGILLSKSKKEATFPIEMATQRLPLPRVIISNMYQIKLFRLFSGMS